ncbi:hypothetical protein C8R47DRAFT_1163787 [Mycena vitilis]|nr:hypothetical protein C8R47DRAFT_1163787 [Mycena vitilis]
MRHGRYLSSCSSPAVRIVAFILIALLSSRLHLLRIFAGAIVTSIGPSHTVAFHSCIRRPCSAEAVVDHDIQNGQLIDDSRVHSRILFTLSFRSYKFFYSTFRYLLGPGVPQWDRAV